MVYNICTTNVEMTFHEFPKQVDPYTRDGKLTVVTFSTVGHKYYVLYPVKTLRTKRTSLKSQINDI